MQLNYALEAVQHAFNSLESAAVSKARHLLSEKYKERFSALHTRLESVSLSKKTYHLELHYCLSFSRSFEGNVPYTVMHFKLRIQDTEGSKLPTKCRLHNIEERKTEMTFLLPKYVG